MHSAVTRATASAPALARPSAGAAIVAAAPRPSISAAARRSSVKTSAVKEVIMPALSSTMTEGKVRSVGADWSCWEEGEGPLSERASERGEIYGSSFFLFVVARSSLARFGPVASRAGQGKGKKRFAALFLSLNGSRIRCSLLRNWSRLMFERRPREERRVREEGSSKEDERFDPVLLPDRRSSSSRALTAAQRSRKRGAPSTLLSFFLFLSFSPLSLSLSLSSSSSLSLINSS